MERRGGGGAGSRPSGVNKIFLLNTVHGLKSHNKREEEEDCWRQHALGHKADRWDRPSNTAAPGRGEPKEEINETAGGISEADARKFWAEQKERAMKATTPPIDTTPAAGGGSSPVAESSDRLKSRKRERLDESPGGSSDLDADRKSKKRARKKKKRKKKEKIKKRELQVRHGAGSGGSGDEGDAEDGKRGSDGESGRNRKKSNRHTEKKRKKRR
ncbi:unnamed protein product [Hapterophycus canaliculatus]